MNVQSSSNFVGANLTVGQAVQAAATYDQTRVNEATEPYGGILKAVNDSFINSLDRYDDDPALTLGELKADLDTQAAAQSKKAKIATYAGIGLVAAGFLGPRLGLVPGSLAMPLLLGGLFSVNWVGGGARAKANNAAILGQQLSDWGQAMVAQGVQPPGAASPQPGQAA